MSDLTSHTRDDLVELPSDCEPAPTVAGSAYLNRPCRSLIAAVRDISAVRDMPIWTFDLIRPRNVIDMAAARARRRRAR
jgi:hypothetical protein